ncbi:MAG: hypothetical protein PHQ47_03000 [Candidatus Portnoybacteria bacterium]|nr:hypothetical protein [Candidatus Portnoybacteria bacterium]
METKNQPESGIASAMLYYSLLNRPLTNIELFKFSCSGRTRTFGHFLKTLETSPFLFPYIRQFRGFYFFKPTNCAEAFAERQKRGKISQLKWKRAKKIAALLQITPFLKMIGITGSLSLANANQESDIDLLIALEPGRLWIGRTFITLLLNLAHWRRHDQKTKDKACLNCYLAGPDMEIKLEIKPRSLHSAQEYSRLIPVWQKDSSVFSKFQNENSWIGEYLTNYPWPNCLNFETVSKNRLAGIIRGFFEFIFSGFLGDKLEKILAKWQTKRIQKKIAKTPDPADQIYFSDEYLMFHPRSKSATILEKHERILKELSLS